MRFKVGHMKSKNFHWKIKTPSKTFDCTFDILRNGTKTRLKVVCSSKGGRNAKNICQMHK